MVVHAGDIGHPSVLDELGSTGVPVHAVSGNNDTPGKWPVSALTTLQRLPASIDLALPGGTLAVEHGHRANPVARRHDRLRERHPDARLILYGHSHRQTIDQQRQPWVVNPGAAGRSRTYGGPSCVMLHATSASWRLEPFRFDLSDWVL